MHGGKGTDVKRAFGERLRQLRRDRAVSQEDLAEAAGLDRTYVSSCERGKRNISIENIDRLARALGVPITELMRFPR